MIYLKSIIAGIVASLLAIVFCALGLYLWITFWVMRSTGEGGIGAVSFPEVAFQIVIGLAFLAGFWWEYRRASRKAGGTA